MEKYLHNGIEVLGQPVNYLDFVKNLSDHGITPTELPIDDTYLFILKYDLEGQTKYAVCNDHYTYLTTQIPDDGWQAMIDDCKSQKNGDKPKRMKSRLSIMLSKAEELAYEDVDKKHEHSPWAMHISSYPEEAQKDFVFHVKNFMWLAGYTRSYLESIKLTETEKEVMNKIMNDEIYW